MKDADKLWASLPLPALLIGADDRIEAVNPAAEQLLMGSEKSLAGKPLFEAVSFENALNEAFERARREDAPLFVRDVGLARSGRALERCDLQLAPYEAARMLLLITPLAQVSNLPKGRRAKTAARSVIGMAEMLAHEIKNPLAGITGAAQLLSMVARR